MQLVSIIPQVLMCDRPTLLTSILISRWSILSPIFLYSCSFDSAKSAWTITTFREGNLAHSYLFRASSLDEFRETSTRLKPSCASWKQKALPMPSVQPVTTAHESFPYCYAQAALRRVAMMRSCRKIVASALEMTIEPTSKAKYWARVRMVVRSIIFGRL